jgi:murein DD-endopeptidase
LIVKLLSAGLLTLEIVLGATPTAAQLEIVAVDVRVPVPPTAFLADGTTHLVYELRITNLDRSQITLSAIDVYADSAPNPLVTRSGDSLRADAHLVGASASTNELLLPTGRQTLVFLWVTLPTGARTPGKLRHRLTVSVMDSTGKAASDTVGGFFVPVRTGAPLVLAAPFIDGPWLAANGPGNRSGHRREPFPVSGVARIGQRFATDWIKLGPDGRAFHGDSLVNSNWYGYGVPLVAVADGIVTASKDSIVENVPFSPGMAVPITVETVGGNHVILDLGGGRYAYYAHLQPGSLEVKRGDRVRRGQPIGLLGNSGNSRAPHLHFQVTDGRSPLGSEGLPWVWERFELLDWLEAGFGAALRASSGWRAQRPAAAKRHEATLENMIVRFP